MELTKPHSFYTLSRAEADEAVVAYVKAKTGHDVERVEFPVVRDEFCTAYVKPDAPKA